MSKYTVTALDNMQCPNQLYGKTDDGQFFYFRGRSGRWQLHFAATEDEVITGDGYEGAEERAGWFEPSEWQDFFWQVVEQIEAGAAEKLDQERHKLDMVKLLVRATTPVNVPLPEWAKQ